MKLEYNNPHNNNIVHSLIGVDFFYVVLTNRSCKVGIFSLPLLC